MYSSTSQQQQQYPPSAPAVGDIESGPLLGGPSDQGGSYSARMGNKLTLLSPVNVRHGFIRKVYLYIYMCHVMLFC